ncbi:hypothetical protein C8A01DRAFT_19075 [Parachaetomium inaequale]|uniref:Uncharacterized protein n=1 Tax=Parachaetomium inaequale TaxID=2588326 RepID=A0AAN6SNW3_9PEZI|nr:hypothetical protein C8A01DRAFT_19075 [Parachaetomium inaequale]
MPTCVPSLVQALPTIPPYYPVLVTNSTKPIQLEVIRQLLNLGCHVRAAVTWSDPARWLDDEFGGPRRFGSFERILLGPGQLSHRSAYRDAVKDMRAIIHAPTVPRFGDQDRSVEEVWSLTCDTVTAMLEAAEHEQSVEAFVYTSSLVAAATPVPHTDTFVTEDSCNATDVIMALNNPEHFDTVRNSCLIRAEQALWHWKRQACPRFKINVVSASNVIGHKIAPEHTPADWRNWFWRLYQKGSTGPVIEGAGPQQSHWYVDVEDVALLHVASIFDEFANERLQAWGSRRDWNDALNVLRAYHVGKLRKEAEMSADWGEEFDLGKAQEQALARYPVIRGDRNDNDGKNKRGQLSTDFTKVLDIFEKWKGAGRWKLFQTSLRESLDLFEAYTAHTNGANGVPINGVQAGEVQAKDKHANGVPNGVPVGVPINRVRESDVQAKEMHGNGVQANGIMTLANGEARSGSAPPLGMRPQRPRQKSRA